MAKYRGADHSVNYVVDLANKPYIEEVRCAKIRGGDICTLVRMGREVTHFKASPGQLKKIRARRGKLKVTERMVMWGQMHRDPAGW